MIMVSSACVDVGGNTYLLALRPVTTGKPSGRAFCKVDEKIGWGLSVVNKMEANPLVFVAGATGNRMGMFGGICVELDSAAGREGRSGGGWLSANAVTGRHN